jgi:peroxiredoxin
MLADGSAEFAKAMGLELDLTASGLGIRSRRFAMVVDDGVVTVLKVEAAGRFDVSSAESILIAL